MKLLVRYIIFCPKQTTIFTDIDLFLIVHFKQSIFKEVILKIQRSDFHSETCLKRYRRCGANE